MPGTVVWRIARRPHALDRLGRGAREQGGRWNHPGTAIIYAGWSVGIAALEAFVHLSRGQPPDLVLVRVHLPPRCSVERRTVRGLPQGWAALPPGSASRDLGTRWALSKRSLVLRVPSALVPEESNAVINPDHPEFGRVRMTIERPFSYDPRMFGRRRPARRGRGRTV